MDNQFYYKKDRLNQLRGFVYTVQCDSCSVKAAEKMGLESTAVSKQIKALESDLGFKLFDRTKNRRLILNDTGKRLYQKAVLAVQNIDSIFQNFSKEFQEEQELTLKIASIEAILGRMIDYTNDFKKKNKKIKIELLNIARDEAFKLLTEGKIDLVFYPGESLEKTPVEFEKEKMAQYQSYWVLYEGHPLASKNEKEIKKEDIAKYPFGYIPNSYISSFRRFIDNYNIESPILLKNGTTELLKEMIRGKMCISALDTFYLTSDDRKKFVLKSSVHNFPAIYYYLFYRKDCELKKIAKDFVEIIKNNKNKIFY